MYSCSVLAVGSPGCGVDDQRAIEAQRLLAVAVIVEW